MRILLLFLALFFAACGKVPDTAEHHHEAMVQLVVYGSGFEIFAEADPFVAGATSEILAHFTHLSDFKPLHNAAVTVILHGVGSPLQQTVELPEKPGIYRFELQPSLAGSYSLQFRISTTEGEVDIDGGEVIVYADEAMAHEAAEAAVIESAVATFFSKEQSWKLDFATGHPQEGPFAEIIRTTARITPAPGDEMLLTAKTHGTVLLAGGMLTEGSAVRTGQTLFTISSGDLADNNLLVRLAGAESDFRRAEADYKRLSELGAERIVSEREVLAARNEYETSKALYESLSRNFAGAGQTVTSPLTGFVHQLLVGNGSYVEAGQPLALVARNQRLMLNAELPQQYASLLPRLSGANLRTLHDNRVYTLEGLNGTILPAGNVTAANNFLIPLKVLIDNHEQLLPGSFVELYLKADTLETALTVPTSALIEEQGVFSVYLQLTPELFEKRAVKVDAGNGVESRILEGITPHDRIVTRGALYIKLAQATGGLDAHSGHVH